MTELNLGGSSVSPAPPTDKPARKPSRALRVTVAALLSLLLPGTGQLYVRKIWRGIALALVVVAIDALVVELRLFMTFAGLVCTIFVIVLLRLSVVCDAVYLAWVYDTANQPPRSWRRTLTALLAIFLLVGYPTPSDYFQKRLLTSFRAYKIASGSMCPTLCEGERVVAAWDAYIMRPPARGDLLLFEFNHTGQIFTKRVIGIAGDTVDRGPANTILVNNATLTFPKPCGDHETSDRLAAEGPPFETVRVPEGSLFVVGDNLDNSYDSRFFGLVTMDEVKSKPQFIYWSHNRSRIGCKLH